MLGKALSVLVELSSYLSSPLLPIVLTAEAYGIYSLTCSIAAADSVTGS